MKCNKIYSTQQWTQMFATEGWIPVALQPVEELRLGADDIIDRSEKSRVESDIRQLSCERRTTEARSSLQARE